MNYYSSIHLFHITTFDNRPKRIPQLRQHHLRHLLPTCPRNIPISNRIPCKHNFISPLRRLSRRRTHTHMRHIPRQHDLLALLPLALQILIEIRGREGTRVVLSDHFLAFLGREFVEFSSEPRVGREDGSAVGDGVDDVHEVGAVASCAVLFQQRRNRFAGGLDFFGLQVAFGISVDCVSRVAREALAGKTRTQYPDDCARGKQIAGRSDAVDKDARALCTIDQLETRTEASYSLSSMHRVLILVHGTIAKRST